jgi:transcriptional regulator with XRE-family HTH domain
VALQASPVKYRSLVRKFGLEVQRRRSGLKLSQEEFADLAGLHRTYVSGLERGVRNPTLDVVLGIARALDAEPADLMPTFRKRSS